MTFWSLLIAALTGHFALHLTIYNRLNATGLRRSTIKRIEKFFVFTCIAIPIYLFLRMSSLVVEGESLEPLAHVELGYAIACVSTIAVLGIPWLAARPIVGIGTVAAKREVTVHHVQNEIDVPLALTAKGRWYSRIPGNQIFDVAVERIELPVVGLPKDLDGLRISHLSDLHFTGDMSREYIRYVATQSNLWLPDVCVITGDIIDSPACIDWLGDVLAPVECTFEKFFILGNHDTRVDDPDLIRKAMTAAGWTDAGGQCLQRIIRQTPLEVIGNEWPWFDAPQLDRAQGRASQGKAATFRMLLSHSPDRFSWARKHSVSLMLAGHTHGGQGRLPIIGPVLSPSWHGSRFASGDFFRSPTTMHVTRGLGAVHLLRLRCRPELSLLTLRCI